VEHERDNKAAAAEEGSRCHLTYLEKRLSEKMLCAAALVCSLLSFWRANLVVIDDRCQIFNWTRHIFPAPPLLILFAKISWDKCHVLGDSSSYTFDALKIFSSASATFLSDAFSFFSRTGILSRGDS